MRLYLKTGVNWDVLPWRLAYGYFSKNRTAYIYILGQAVQEECEDITILQNVSKYLSTDTASYPRRLQGLLKLL